MKYEAYFLVLCINYVYDYLQSASINDKWENYGYAKYKNMFSSLSLSPSSILEQQDIRNASNVQHLRFYQLCTMQQ